MKALSKENKTKRGRKRRWKRIKGEVEDEEGRERVRNEEVGKRRGEMMEGGTERGMGQGKARPVGGQEKERR